MFLFTNDRKVMSCITQCSKLFNDPVLKLTVIFFELTPN